VTPAPVALRRGRRSRGIVPLVLSKIVLAAVLSFGVATVSFIAIHALPGDLALKVAASRYPDEAPTKALAARVRKEARLDAPIAIQYGRWLGGLVTNGLGRSLVNGRSVAEILRPRLVNSARLAGYSLLGAALIALPLGLAAGLKPGGTVDRLRLLYSGVFAAVPTFLLAILLIEIIAVRAGAVRLVGPSDWPPVALPALTAALAIAALLATVVRNAVAEVAGSPYVAFARMRGVPDGRIVADHITRNSALPVLSFLATLFVFLVYDLVVLEVVFGFPGVGLLLYEALIARDLPVVQGAALVVVFAYLVLTAAVDVTSRTLDPRLVSRARS